MDKRWAPEGKLGRLVELRDAWDDCTKCKLSEKRNNIVFGSGYVDADLMFLGEGPGEVEDLEGDPFVGEAGKLLDDLFESVGMERDEVFISNLVMCRPPSNRDPTKIEREACAPRLYEQIRLVDPLLIIPIGKVAMKALLKSDWKSILDRHGELGEIEVPSVLHVEPLKYSAMPIIHPAFILRAEGVDPRTGKWPEEGYCHKTLRDLTMALDMVRYLQKQYKETRVKLRGHPALRVME